MNDARTHPRASNSRVPPALRRAGRERLKPPPFSPRRLGRVDPSPLEEGWRRLRATSALPLPPGRDRKRLASYDLGNSCPIVTSLAGDALDATTVCGDGRWTRALDYVGRADPSEGPPSTRVLLPQTRESDGPLLIWPVRAPLEVVDSSCGGLDAPAALVNQPRPPFRRHPAKGDAFPETRVLSTLRNPT